jgi:hypothetical protein
MLWEWDTAAGGKRSIVAVLPEMAAPVAASPGLQVLAYYEHGAIKLLHVPTVSRWTSAAATPPLPSTVTALALSHDGGRLVSGHANGEVRVYRVHATTA